MQLEAVTIFLRLFPNKNVLAACLLTYLIREETEISCVCLSVDANCQNGEVPGRLWTFEDQEAADEDDDDDDEDDEWSLISGVGRSTVCA